MRSEPLPSKVATHHTLLRLLPYKVLSAPKHYAMAGFLDPRSHSVDKRMRPLTSMTAAVIRGHIACAVQH